MSAVQYNFKDRMYELIEKQGLTLKEFEQRTGLNRRTFVNWTNGRYPNSSLLIDIADELQVSTDELLGLKNADATLAMAIDDAKLAGCKTCRYGKDFGSGVSVCINQECGQFPKLELACWEWRGLVRSKEKGE